MSNELEPTYRFRHQVPEAWRSSLDTRIVWLWNQRFGTVQSVRQNSTDLLDVTAANLLIQAILHADLASIELILTRIEGGAVEDVELLDKPTVV